MGSDPLPFETELLLNRHSTARKTTNFTYKTAYLLSNVSFEIMKKNAQI